MTENPLGQLFAAVWLFGGIVTWIVATPLWWRANKNALRSGYADTESYALAGFEGFMTGLLLPLWLPLVTAVGVFWVIGRTTSRLVGKEETSP